MLSNFWQVTSVGVIDNEGGTIAICIAATIALLTFVTFTVFAHVRAMAGWVADWFKDHGYNGMVQKNSIFHQTLV